MIKRVIALLVLAFLAMHIDTSCYHNEEPKSAGIVAVTETAAEEAPEESSIVLSAGEEPDGEEDTFGKILRSIGVKMY